MKDKKIQTVKQNNYAQGHELFNSLTFFWWKVRTTFNSVRMPPSSISPYISFYLLTTVIEHYRQYARNIAGERSQQILW